MNTDQNNSPKTEETNKKAVERNSCWENSEKESSNNVNTIKVLSSIKNNATMAKRATETVIEQVDNKQFADILKEQVIKYDDFARRADKLANSTGILLDDQGGLGQFFAKANIKMKLMSDHSIVKVAELMIL